MNIWTVVDELSSMSGVLRVAMRVNFTLEIHLTVVALLLRWVKIRLSSFVLHSSAALLVIIVTNTVLVWLQ